MLTKELINNIAAEAGITKKKAEELLNAMTSTMVETLTGGTSIQLLNLGTLEVKQRAERVIVHPRTGERSTAPEKRQVTFRPTNAFKDEVKTL